MDEELKQKIITAGKDFDDVARAFANFSFEVEAIKEDYARIMLYGQAFKSLMSPLDMAMKGSILADLIAEVRLKLIQELSPQGAKEFLDMVWDKACDMSQEDYEEILSQKGDKNGN